jgi:hypothetical protein
MTSEDRWFESISLTTWVSEEDVDTDGNIVNDLLMESRVIDRQLRETVQTHPSSVCLGIVLFLCFDPGLKK